MERIIACILLTACCIHTDGSFEPGKQNIRPPEEKPNIILIMADDLGHETIGCYGGTSYQTPRIDRMAADGMRFEHCYSQPLCTPSRVKIMTGKYNFRNYERFGYMDMNETTFAHLLKSKGYATCIAGKWQLKGDAYAPYKAGFDEYFLWQITFTSYNERYKNPRVLENGRMIKYENGEYGPQLYTNYILDFMERNRDDPFLVYYPMALPHRPYVPTPDSEDYDDFAGPGGGDAKAAVSDTTYFKDEVRYMDKVVGEIVDKIRELGIHKNTLILFTSDNGTGHEVVSMMGDRSIPGMKGQTNSFGTHVPLVAIWEGTIEPGQENKNLIDFSDFLPTLCDAAQVKLPGTFITDGFSFLPQMKGGSYIPREWIFCHYHSGKDQFPKRRFVHNKEWKLYESGEIFQISSDPWERNPVSEEEMGPGEKELISTFRSVLSEMQTGVSARTISLTVNGRPVRVMEQNDVPLIYGLNSYKYARITHTGEPLSIKIAASGFRFGDEDWDISPRSYGIEGEKLGNGLSFEIDRTGYLVVRFSKDQDFTKKLVLFIEPPERLPGEELVDIVKRYGIDNTGKRNETVNIQQALDEISGTGKVLFFPAGRYRTFGLEIKSHSMIHLSKQARIIADASSPDAYHAGNGDINRFILIEDANHIQVTGQGTLDGNGSAILGLNDPAEVEQLDGMRLLLIRNSRAVSFEGTVLKDAARWNTHIVGCEDVVFRNCKLINSMINNEQFGSLDGWDPDASKRVLIEDCFCWAGDDAVAVKCTGYGNPRIIRDVEDITVRGCVLLTKKTAMKIGTETRCASMKHIVFENNDIVEADRAIGINVRDRAVVEDVLYKDNRVEYYYPDRKQMPVNIYITRREDDQPWTGKILNTRIEQLMLEQEFPNRIQVSRIESHTEPEDLQVTFRNLVIAGHKISSLNPSYFHPERCNGTIRFD